MKTSYWIQEQAPDGGWFDSIGLPVGTSKEEAITRLKSWQQSFPGRATRLIERTDKEVAK